MERLKKKERELKDIAEGPHSRTEQNNFKKVGTCLALLKVTVYKLSSDL